GVLFVEPDCGQGGVQTFPDVLQRFMAPAIRDDARAHTAEPDLSLRKLRVEPLCLPEQLPGSQMGLPANVVKMPGPLPHQVPGGHIARVASSGRKRLRLE